MNKKVCIVLVGGPCSGKSSVGKMTAADLCCGYISSGDIARKMAKYDNTIRANLDSGRLAPEDKMRRNISTLLWQYFKIEDNDVVILDGFPRFGDQAKWLRKELPLSIDIYYVLFYAPLSMIIERSANRDRPDDKSLRQRLGYYYNTTYKELYDYITTTIDTTEASVDECSALLTKFVKEVMKC